jgi:TP901 family phage tail tape measure protein
VADDLRIIIQATLDTSAQAVTNLDKQIAELSKKVSALDLKINVDTDTLNKFISSIERVKKIAVDANKIVSETQYVYKKLDGSVETVTEKVNKMGEVIKKTRIVHDENKKAAQQETKVLDDQRKTLEDLLNEYDRFSKNVRTKNTYNANGELIGAVHTLQDKTNNNKLVVKTNNEGFVTNYSEIEEYLKNYKDAVAEEKRIDDERVKNYNETYRTRKAIEQQALKEEEIYIRAHQENAKKNLDFEQSIADRRAKIDDLMRRFGADKNVAQQLKEVNEQLSNIKFSGNNGLTGISGNYKTALRDIDIGLKNITASAKTATSHTIGFGEALSTAMQKFPVWMVATTAFYAPLHALQDGIKYVYDLDTALTDLTKTSDLTKDGFASFTKQATQTANSIGALTLDVIKSTTEWTRLGYSLEQAQQLAKQTAIYQNVGDIPSAEQASENLISAIKGFGIEVDAQGKNIEHLVDVYNEVGNKFSISSAGIGEAAKRGASALHEAGNTMEEAVALITAANASVQDPAKVGNALKTISLRLRGISEDGEDLSDLVPTLEKNFQSIGLTLKKDETTFKSTYEIFSDLAKVWDQLNGFQRSNILELVAGKEQANVASSLIQNWEDAEGALEAGLNSFGSAARENAKYLDSLQGHVARFRNAVNDFWGSNVMSDTLKDIVDTGTTLIYVLKSLTDTFGGLNLIIFAVTASLLKFTSAGNSLSKTITLTIPGAIKLGSTIEDLKNRINVMSTALTRFPKTVQAAGASLTTLRLALIGTQVAAAALETTLTLGLSLAITAIASGITSLVGHYQKAKQKQEEYAASVKQGYEDFKSNIDQVNALADQYEKLSNIKSPSTEDHQKLLDVQQKLSEILPEVVQGYDQEGNAIYANASEVKKLVEEYKKLNYERAKYISDTLADNAEEDAKKISGLREEIIELTNDYKEASANFEALNFIKKFFNENNLSELDQFSDEYQNKIEELHKGVQSIFDKYGVATNETAFTAKALFDFKEIDQSIEEARSKSSRIQSEIKTRNDEILQHQKTFIEGFQAYNETLFNDFNIADDNIKNFFNKLSEGFVESNNISKSNFKDMIANYRQFVDEIINLYQSGKLDLTKLDSFDGLQELKIQLENLQSDFKGFTIPVSVIDNLISSLSNNVKQGTQDFFDYEKIFTKLKDTFEEVGNELKPLNQALYDVSKGQSLTADTVADLVLQYPQLASAVKKTVDGWTIEKEALEAVRQTKLDYLETSQFAEAGITNELYKQVEQRLAAYGLELDMISDLASAREAAAKIFYDEKNKSDTPIMMGGALVGWEPNEEAQQAIEALFKIGKIREEFNNRLKKLYADPNLGVSKPKSKSKNEPDFIDPIQARINAINKEAQARAELNKVTEERVKDLESEEKYAQALEKTNVLLASQQKEISLLNQANAQLQAEQEKLQRSSKYDMSKWTDDNGEQTEAYIKLYNSLSKKAQESLSKQFNEWQLLDKAIISNKNSIDELNSSIQDTIKYRNELKLKSTQQYLEKLSKDYDALNDEINYSKNLQSLMTENSAEYNAERQKQIDLYRQLMKQYEEDNIWITRRLKANESAKESEKLTQEQIDLLNETLKENKDAWFEAARAIKANEKEMADYREKLADEIIDNYKEMLEKRRDLELDALDASIDAEEKRHDTVMDNLDKEMDAFEELINARLKAMDRANEEEDYQANLEKLLKERAEIQEKYNTLLKDNSFEAKARRAELAEQIAAKDEEIAQLQKERGREIAKQGLEDQLADREDYIDAQKELEDKLYESNKKKLEDEKKLREDYWNSIIEDEQAFYDLKQQLLSNDTNTVINAIESIKSKYAEFFSYLASQSSTLGQMYKTINSNFQLDYNKLNEYLPVSLPTLSLSASDWAVVDQMKINSQKWYSDPQNKAFYEAENKRLGASIGATFDPKKGAWFKNGIRLYHEGGKVGEEGTTLEKWWNKILNSNEVPAILKAGEVVLDKPLNFVNDVVQRTVNGLSSLVANTAFNKSTGKSNGDTVIQRLQVSINGNFNQKDGEDVWDSFVSGLNRKGIRI